MLLFFVLYDGINHSIFEGQVLQPLLKRFESGFYFKIHIISFEQTFSEKLTQLVAGYENSYPALSFSIFKRNRFISSFFLQNQIHILKTFLSSFSSYHLIARGPLAGYLAKHAITFNCLSLTIQARGLLAEEFSYTHRQAPLWKWPFITLRIWQLRHFEKKAYTPLENSSIPFSIESVSDALSEYLQTTYNFSKHFFIPALFDAPQPIIQTQKSEYAAQVKKELFIDHNAIIYVFNGSLKPWQCPQESIAYFKKEWLKDNRSFFLALTHETEAMKALIASVELPTNSFKVLSVLQKDVIRYLCTAQYGFLLREPHIINWVSRPTKLLEYQAAHIQIIHHNTIALLTMDKLDKQGHFKRK